MKLFSSKKRVAAIGALTAATLVGGGMAYAYWTNTGAGAGSATTGDSTTYEVVFGATSGLPLSPDGPTQSTDVTVTNNGNGVQQVNSVQVSVANADGTPWTAVTGCSAADFSVNSEPVNITAELLGSPVPLAPGGDTGALPVTIQMINRPAVDQEGCKNVTDVPLYAYAS